MERLFITNMATLTRGIRLCVRSPQLRIIRRSVCTWPFQQTYAFRINAPWSICSRLRSPYVGSLRYGLGKGGILVTRARLMRVAMLDTKKDGRGIGPKKRFFFGSGFRPTLSIYARPKLFYELGKKTKKKRFSLLFFPHKYSRQHAGSIRCCCKKSPTYHSLPLEK